MLKSLRLATLVSVITLTPFGLASAHTEPLKVVASFSIIGDFAKNVGGDRIDLTTLVGPNGDAHVYEPKPADAMAMSKADVVLVNGLHFEGFLQRLVEASATNASIAELTKGVEPINMSDEHHDEGEEDESHAHSQGDLDPHAFQSIANAKIYVKNIADAFCAADAEGCESYKANAEAYTQKLAETDDYVKATVASIPEDKRTIITSHDAFGYFEHAYGLTFLAPEGISTEAEASAADVAALIRQIREDKASAIFVENITNARLIEQIAAETGVKLGGTLYSDALSSADGPAATYIDMMRSNIATIKGAITGS
ncbi:zinc ABC transporter substrate-binding protein AztC [Mesorhizobium sp. KR2-14]|uniref:zinc ABC transporter substrate-binding protein AztC n=1 Tax=Mesorhizobium sp. KR2-14 TaxID=3156610 RepID=UPI0032B4752F